MTKPMDWRSARDLLLERAVPVSTETVSLDNAAGLIFGCPDGGAAGSASL